MFTMETATEYVTRLVETTGAAHATDLDVSAIVTTLNRLAEGWDFDIIDRSTFWTVIASHILLPRTDNPTHTSAPDGSPPPPVPTNTDPVPSIH
ncbi:hypothetical protein NOVA_27390 [Nocardia nova]|uniref:hypothetical protein n=1 Tax=Nocardia nova TaxID=37330 RepID=UPI001C455501|nr:hypothetical protein [Nocardia nova]MBV7706516.1 hypothetical protein [Nocardia nova]